MGTSVHIFGEDGTDAAQHLMGNVTLASQQISGSAQQLMGSAGRAASESAKFARNVAGGTTGLNRDTGQFIK
jgi:hypothetical protein